MRLRAGTSGHRYGLEISGEGAPLLLLHGFSGDGSSWGAVAAALSREYRVIALDILGHGASAAPADVASYGMEAVAADIIDLLDRLKVDRAHLLGYSMGGRLALFLALRRPGRFGWLALESASPGLADADAAEARRRRDEALASRIERHGVGWFVDYWEGLPLWSSQSGLAPAVLAAQRRQRARNHRRGLANSLRGMGLGAQPSLWRDLPRLARPTLLLAGELDVKFRRINEAMAELMPGAALAIVPGAGHNVHLENPAGFMRALRTFLQGL